MTDKRYTVIDKKEPRSQSVAYNGIHCTARTCVTRLNRLTEENEQLKIRLNEEKEKALKFCRNIDTLTIENEQLKQRIKDLRLEVLDSLHDADDIQCSCNPCVVEECVKRVVE